METPAAKTPFAWQPLTWPGVAAFARCKLGRVLAVQLVVALLAAASVDWFLYHAWFPVVRSAILRLPSEGAIRGGKLVWIGQDPVLLAENRFLAFSVDLKDEATARSPAHVQVEFGQSGLEIISILGYVPRAYPQGYQVAFNRPELQPWWGAWAPAFLAIAAVAVVASLMATWWCLATIYCLPVWLVGFFANRQLSLRASWRLAGAALVPGALFMTGAIILYGFEALDLVRLGVALALHFVIGWVYVIAAPCYVPPLPGAEAVKTNPFTPQA